MLPSPGSYRAQQHGRVIVKMESTGSLMAYIPFLLINCSEVVNFSEEYALCLAAKDGTPQQRNIDTMKKLFPSWDWENMADVEMPEEGVEIPKFDLADCFHDDSYTPDGADSPLIQFKAKWLNIPGESGKRRTPMTDVERKAAVSKYKAKFKALGATASKTTTATKPAATAAKTAAPAKAASGGPPGRKAAASERASTQEAAWEKIQELNPEEGDQADAYYKAIDAVLEGGSEDPEKLTPEQWGQVMTNLEV